MSEIKHKAGGLKARDVESYVKTMGFEKGITRAVAEIAEQQRALEHTQIQVGQALDQMTDLLVQFSDVAGRMKESHQDILLKMQGNDRPDLPSALGDPT